MKRNRRRGPGPVPDRWLYCPQNSINLIALKFLALKTPLSKDFNKQLPLNFRFPPEEIFSFAKTTNEKIGLWIDLTNTNRYYNKEDIVNEGCKYVKLTCKGHDEPPSVEKSHLFISLVHEFVMKHPFESIAVHCTHGFNRTGFLIVSFLVEKLKIDISTALNSFADSRPPGIYKGDYIKELYRRYGNIEDAPLPPILPKWCEIVNRSGRKRKFEERDQ